MDMLPITSRAEQEQYQIESRMEIIGLLREVIASHTLVTLYYDGPKNFVLTTILTVNPEFEEIVLDASSDPRDTEALIGSSRITVVGLLDHVKIQFDATRAERISFEDGDAIRIRLPETMLRLQRRNFYRIATPVTHPLEVHVPPGKGRTEPAILRLVDLSVGGVGVVYQPSITLTLGMILPGCRLDLPDMGSITSPLEVRYLMHTAGPAGAHRTRCGLQFLHLPPASMTLLQRYINKLDRERRMRT